MSRYPARPLFSAAVYAWMTGALAVHVAICILLLPYTMLFDRDRQLAARIGAGIVRFSLSIPASWRPAVRAIRTIDLERPAIVVMNHRSITDVAIACAVPRAPRLSAKPWIAKVPLFRWSMWMAGHRIFEPGDLAAVRDSVEYLEGLLRRGVSVLLFPEGSRQTGPEETLGEFESGAFWLATRTGVDILPVVLRATGDLVPKGRAMFFLAPVRVEVLPRIPAGTDRDELSRRVREAMATRLAGPPAS